jgi:hypothetical protein
VQIGGGGYSDEYLPTYISEGIQICIHILCYVCRRELLTEIMDKLRRHWTLANDPEKNRGRYFHAK